MKKNTKPTDRKKLFAICGLSALCIAVLAGAYFLTREPEREFIPASAERADVTDTWEEKSGTDAILPDAAAFPALNSPMTSFLSLIQRNGIYTRKSLSHTNTIRGVHIFTWQPVGRTVRL